MFSRGSFFVMFYRCLFFQDVGSVWFGMSVCGVKLNFGDDVIEGSFIFFFVEYFYRQYVIVMLNLRLSDLDDRLWLRFF